MTNPLARRDFFRSAAAGLYGTALAYLFGREFYGGSGLLAADAPAPPRLYDLSPKQPHFQPRAKAIIQLFMQGGPSQLGTFAPHPGTAIGGDTKAIKTSVPGIKIGSGLERVAQQLHHIALVRSVISDQKDPVSYTHLPLPTNREV